MKKLFLFASLILVFAAGCQKDNSVLGPVSEKSSLQKASWEKAAQAQGLHFIALPQNTQTALSKDVLTTTELVKTNATTILKVQNKYKADNGNHVSIKAVLTVLPNAVDQDTYLTMSFTDENLMTDVDLTFGPHPFSFNIPALLDVDASGLDLSGLSPNTKLKLMYFNEATGLWEEMNADEVSFDIQKGQIKCKNGQLPHFSRYGFTRDEEGGS